MERALAGRDRVNHMLDAYGTLLTPRQRQLLVRYYQDDLSLGEIAAQMRVSRQAVHDGLRRALGALERFEAALGLAAQARRAPAEHYSARAPQSAPRPRVLRVALRGRSWTFQVAAGVFSARGLDPGTRLLIEAMAVGPRDRVLDLGCGYGPVGLVAASMARGGRAWLIDANRRAAALARANAVANGITNAHVLVGDGAGAIRSGAVDVVVTNPPIRAGRRVVATFIDDAWRVLRPGGRFCLVARTAQGAKTLAGLMEERFGQVRQVRRSGGYRVYEAVRAPQRSGARQDVRARDAGDLKESARV